MANEKSRFFDSVEGDRTYTSAQFAEYFRIFLTNGILNGGTNLQVSADGSGMRVTVGYGAGMIQGYAYWLEDEGNNVPMGLQIPTASAATPRIDRVVLRLDIGSTRDIHLLVLTGTPASTPVPPTLTRTTNVYDLSLARISVAKNALAIYAADITDERTDPAVCGLVNSLITVDTREMQEQFDAFMATITAQSPVLHSEIVDNLTTNDASKVLSAKQGKSLQDGKAAVVHTHAGGDITSGAVAVNRGGTGATDANGARSNLGAAATSHQHGTGDITSGTLPLGRGGTGATDATGVRNNIGAAATSHTHDASAIVSGRLAVTQGGTGAWDAWNARNNLEAQKIISYGTGDPSGGSDGDMYIKYS